MTYTWREELAWAAGFWDGEGSTSIVKRDNSLVASISQVDDEVESLHRFQNAVLGIGKIYGPHRQKNMNHRSFFNWHAYGGSKVQAVIAMLWPFLGNIKKEQAAKALKSASWKGEGMCQSNKHLLEKVGITSTGRCRECHNIAKKLSYYRVKDRNLALTGGI
jgi:hypothetical protein